MRVYLASLSSGMSIKLRDATIVKHQPRYLLETFFNGAKDCDRALQAVGVDHFLLDSGAFSYLNGTHSTLEQMEDYIARYIGYIKSRGVKYFFEIDVDKLFGIRQVENWRHRIERETGLPCIPVWHKQRGVDYWIRMCREYGYIAIGGLVLDMRTQEFESVRKLVAFAHDRGNRVHGLGFTKTIELPHYKFFSVDSSSWCVGAAWGQQLYTFRDGWMQYRYIKQEGRRANIEKIIAHNFGEWVKYQKFADSWRY